MNFLFTALLFTATALAAPAAAPVALAPRQISGASTSNDFFTGGCKPVIMLYARGSAETGNIGTLGPAIKSGLNGPSAYGDNFAMQGVDYPALIADNFRPGGTSLENIGNMTALVNRVVSECPTARIAIGGYNQGTALAARTIEKLPTETKDRIGAVVLLGYTQNQQLNGGIPGFPQSKIKVFCNSYNLPCSTTFPVIPQPHFPYPTDEAVDFILEKLGSL